MDNQYWWDFQHHHLEGPHYRLVGTAPQTQGGEKHLLQYTLTPKKTIKFNQGDIDKLDKVDGGYTRGAMKSGVFTEHQGHEEHDPNYHDPRPPKASTPASHDYYHGTTVPNVSHILPARQHGGPQVFGNGLSSPDHAYATTSESDAWDYAEKAWNAAPSGRPRVYKVHPIGGHEDVEPDPQEDEHGNNRYVNQNDHRSTQGFHVLHEMPFPHHFGDPEDWDR